MNLSQDQLWTAAHFCMAFKARKASRSASRVYAEALAPLGLEVTQFSLLTACSLANGIAVTPLAKIMGMEQSALVRALAVLEKNGLVTLTPGQDRRVRHVALTPAGEDQLEAAWPLWNRIQTQVEQAFGAERMRHLISELGQFEAVLTAL